VSWAALVLALLGAPAANAAAPSFDCARAESSAEKLICADPTLGTLDQELARLFALARDGPDLAPERRSTLIASQRGWIRGRDDCWKADDLRACVVAEYLSRILDLRRDYTAARSADAAGISLGPFIVTCESLAQPGGLAIVKTNPELAYLGWPEGYLVLTQIMSGSGARYAAGGAGGELVFWIKSKSAMFERPGQATVDCHIE
jgi:uncharacterized protein